MKKNFISVIVPVYNVESFISECIESILNQTFTNFELLLIDDGSLDRSGLICDEYAIRDSRIHVIHKKNGGVSSARNFGIDKAQGEWITFVDSDDRLEPDALLVCFKYITKYQTDFIQFLHNRATLFDNIKYNEPVEMAEYIKKNHPVCIGGSCFKTDIIRFYKIRFIEDIKLGEDQLFIFDYLRNAKKCILLNTVLYYYRINTNSATMKMRACDILQSLYIFNDFKKNNSLFEFKIDNMLLSLFMSRQVIMKYNTVFLYRLYKSLWINNPSFNSNSTRIYYYLSKINVILALYWAKLYYTLR